MFGIDFPELVVIAVVALIVLGPERLPKAARFAGLWVRRARAQWSSVKNELERELAADEFRRGLHDTEAAMREIDADVRAADAQARREFDTMRGGMAGNRASAEHPSTAAPSIAAPAATATTDGTPFDTFADFDPHAVHPHAAGAPAPPAHAVAAAPTPGDHRDAAIDDDAPVLMTGPAVSPTRPRDHDGDPRSG